MEGLSSVIAANYAFCTKATIQFLPPRSIQDVDEIYDDFFKTHFQRGTERGQKARQSLDDHLKQFNVEVKLSGKEKLLTFVTHGVPYGYFFPEIPSTHLISGARLGCCIFDGIFAAITPVRTKAAVIIDPGFFNPSETGILEASLRKSGAFVKTVSGSEAKVYSVRNYIQFFPYDFLHICSHGSEMKGRRLTIRFLDRRNAPHEIVLDEAVSLGATGKGKGEKELFQVDQIHSYVAIDGVDWMDEKKKEIIKDGAFQDFLKIPRERLEIVSVSDVDYVKHCNAIKLSDDWCPLGFHSIASGNSPIIFNNACVSFFDCCTSMIYGGARSYIGTLAPVDTDIAKTIAEKLIVTRVEPLTKTLWEIQRELYPQSQDRIYIHVGCHFNALIESAGDSKSETQNEIKIHIYRLIEKINEPDCPEDVRRNSIAAVEFLGNVLRTEFAEASSTS